MVARLLSLLLVVLLAGPAWGQITTQTHSTIPSATSSFMTDMQNFLANEDAQRYHDMFTDFVVAGGVISTGAGLTKTPTALTAYANGYWLSETGSITFVNGITTFVIANSVTTGNAGGYTRVSGTHYLTAPSPDPGLPAGAIRIATVVTAGNAVTGVTDTRNLFALSLAQGGLAQNLSAAPNGTLLIGNGAGFTQNTLTAGSGISVTNGAGTIQLDAQGTGSWMVHGNKSFVATTATMTLAADSVTLKTTTQVPNVQFAPANVTNTVTTAGPTANGRDQVGAFAANSWIHFYWIWNGTTLASVSSTAAPNVGPTFPAGYTHWAYCCSARFDGGSLLIFVRCYGGWCYYETQQNILSAGAAVAETAVTIANTVPPNATQFRVNGQAQVHNDGIAASDVTATLRVVTAKDFFRTRIQTNTSGQWNSTSWEATLPNVALFYLWNNATHSTNALDIDVTGYKVGE